MKNKQKKVENNNENKEIDIKVIVTAVGAGGLLGSVNTVATVLLLDDNANQNDEENRNADMHQNIYQHHNTTTQTELTNVNDEKIYEPIYVETTNEHTTDSAYNQTEAQVIEVELNYNNSDAESETVNAEYVTTNDSTHTQFDVQVVNTEVEIVDAEIVNTEVEIVDAEVVEDNINNQTETVNAEYVNTTDSTYSNPEVHDVQVVYSDTSKQSNNDEDLIHPYLIETTAEVQQNNSEDNDNDSDTAVIEDLWQDYM